ncbi:penicillin-binding protein 1A [Olivibacter domesticus]|uniref:Penicillin-binding protein 1A n=1 Tax=Olivibacter domesticus TaxID=407022 RepID=A0A1H7X952_OLID1|nr:transglycosylase domain-containing protein [Olivibacter domesticus]SEM30412.1 penicillin-binding protein 1A [Olivibacter domesticus]
MQRNTKKQNNKLTNEDIKRYTLSFWKFFVGLIILGFLFLISIGLGLFGELPSFRDLENPKSNLSSEIISADGAVLGTYYIQNRSNVTYKELSPALIKALIATEDIRFNSHSGIDFKRTFTIIFYNLIGKKQGASTITQQLALNLFQEEGRARSFSKRFIQKLQEWIIAVRLEQNYTKEEILTMYLNTVDFGAYNTYGIKSAARTYFNTTPGELNPGQAAVLVGMLKGPGIYSPIRYPKNSINRRNTVLDNMRKSGFLTAAEAASFKEKPLGLTFRPNVYGDGIAPYLRAVLKTDIKNIFNQLSITKADGTPYDLDRDGLKIYTTIDSRMQLYAEEAQKTMMKELQVTFNNQYKGRDPFKGLEVLLDRAVKQSDRYRWLKNADQSDEEIKKNFNSPTKMSIFSWKGELDTTMTPMDSIKYNKLMLRNAMMSMEPQTGYVKAWVGGINFTHYKYDQVKMGARQPGSTAKPFTYAVAIDNGYSPCFKVPNAPINVDGWAPKSESTVAGPITLKTALAHSQNWATADVIQRVGAQNVANLIKNMGITTDVPAYPSIALGTFDASVYDMVGAYSTFVNHGVWTQPIYLLRIEDKNGALIYEHTKKVKVVMNDQSAYVMVDMLKGVVEKGSGQRVRWKYKLMNPIGGKTGTSQSNSDAWFIGVTPQLVSGVWTGAEERAIHFSTTALGQGANAALPMFALFMQKVYADKELKYSQGDFELPPGGLQRELDCSKYQYDYPSEDERKIDDRLDF